MGGRVSVNRAGRNEYNALNPTSHQADRNHCKPEDCQASMETTHPSGSFTHITTIIDLMSKKHILGKTAAECAARRSPLLRFKTGCAFVRDGDLISMGWSHRGATILRDTPWSTHSEMHAAQRARWDVEGATCYVMTLSKRGNVTCGRPCNESCYPLLRRLGVSKVIWTKSGGLWVEEYVDLGST